MRDYRKMQAKSNEARSLRVRKDYEENPKRCLFCNNAIPYGKHYENKFCNHSCAAKFNNKSVPRICLNCPKSLSYQKKFCSHTCNSAFNQAISAAKFIANDNLETIFKARRFFLERDGNRCTICSTTEWCGKQTPLVMDHINGNSDDWSIENCRMICPNCDAQTPTYKSKNKGNGRHSRKMRYQEGKSY